MELNGLPFQEAFAGNDYFKTYDQARTDMRNSMREILGVVSSSMPEVYLDPSKYVDATEGKTPPIFTKEDLH